MATLRMPTFPNLPNHRYNIVLDGDTFILEFKLNTRADKWSFDLLDVQNTVIRRGIRLVEGSRLLKRIVVENRPLGELIVVDPTGEGTEPNEQNLGTEASFRYIEGADL